MSKSSKSGALAAEHLQLLLDSLEDVAIFALDQRGLVQSWNTGAQLLKGYAADEIIGTSFRRFYTEEAQQQGEPERLLRRAEETGRVETEGWRLRKDGSRFWALVLIRAMRDSAGALVGFAKMTRNLTDREKELREVNTFLDSIVENIPSMVFVKRAKDLRFVRFNRAGEALLGITRDRLIGKTDFDLFDVEQASAFQARDRETLKQGETVDIPEEPIDTASGQRWLHTRKVTILDEHQQPAYLLGISEDITRSRRLARELRDAHGAAIQARNELEQRVKERTAELAQKEKTFRDLFDGSADAILVVAEGGAILLANAESERMFGYPRGGLVGEAVEKLVPEQQRGDRVRLGDGYAAAPRRQMMAKGQTLTGCRRDGTTFPVDISLAPTLHEGKNATLATIRDASQRVATESQLRQAQKMEAVGKLAGGIAHDFNNILSVVLSYAELLRLELGESDPNLAAVDGISTAAKRATELTRQLLAFGRRQILQPRAVDLGEIVSGVEGLLRRLIGEHIEMSIVLTSKLELVQVDASQIEQVIINLAVNARDAMPHGGSLVIETGNIALDDEYEASHIGVPAGRYVVLAVSDTGMGMDEATKSRIFEPFFTTKQGQQGTGLGLATVFGIVTQSGGHIWVYSELNRGTTFKVYFPVSSAERPQRAESSDAPPRETGSETILLVEDDAALREVTSMILRRQGYHVLEAANGLEALSVGTAYKDRIHLMLTDVVMPKMSGREAAEAMHAIHPEAKVLYMSGYTDNSIVHHGVLKDGIAFLQKPVTPSRLTSRVRQLLDE